MDTSIGSAPRRRPLGVWAFTLFYTLLSGLGIISSARTLMYGPPHGVGIELLMLAPWSLGLCVALLISTWGTWFGSNAARFSLLLVLVLFVAMDLHDIPDKLRVLFDEHVNADTREAVLLLILQRSGVYLGVLGLTCWYFLRGPTRDFYKRH